MKQFTFLILLMGFNGTLAEAQNKELRERFLQLQKELSTQSYRVNYTLSVVTKNNRNSPESLSIEVSRDKNNQRAVYGNYQEVIQEEGIALVVNHLQKDIIIQRKVDLNLDEQLLNKLVSFIDSAQRIEITYQSGTKIFTMQFPQGHTYAKIQVGFSKSQALKILYAEFSPLFPDNYHSVHVKYEKWEKSWKPEEGFPHFDKYVAKEGLNYKLLPFWNHYSFYQPESGTLKF